MRINFLMNQVFDGWEPTDTRLGGTEESVVKWAEELVKRAHQVTIWYNPREGVPDQRLNGVFYFNRNLYKSMMEDGRIDDKAAQLVDGDRITINIKSSEIAPIGPTLYLTNEVDADKLDLSAYAGVIWPSQWAVDNIPVNNKTFILPHGYDPKKIYPGKKVPKQCFYASSPDRGLDTLLEAWPKVVESHPDATLLLTYGAPQINSPGIINLGEVDEDTMSEIYRTSEYWLHPCNGGELYCMTGIKAQAAECIPLVIPTMALEETVQVWSDATAENYGDKLIELLKITDEQKEYERSKLASAKELGYFPTWEDSTDRLLEIINEVIQ